MRISTEGNRRDVELAINWMGGVIGAEMDKRVSAFEKQERTNPILASHFRENFPLEFAFVKARKYRKNTGRLPKGDEYDQLYSFAVPALRIHAALPAEIRTKFEGRLRGAVNGNFGARPLAFEIGIATHLMQKNWDVEFADYDGKYRFDFLARRASAEIEVECKTFSGDTGRKIHRQEAHRLADLLRPHTEKLADRRGCHLIQMTLVNRLGKASTHLADLVAVFSAATSNGRSATSELANVEYKFEDIQDWPEPGSSDFRSYFESRFGLTNVTLFLHSVPGFSVVAVALECAEPDSVVKTIAAQAKEAADQCTGTRPALIALRFIDHIDRSALEVMLRTANGMHTIAGSVFNDPDRSHVDSVPFTIPQKPTVRGDGAMQLSAPIAVLNNPAPRFVCNEIRSVFSS